MIPGFRAEGAGSGTEVRSFWDAQFSSYFLGFEI